MKGKIFTPIIILGILEIIYFLIYQPQTEIILGYKLNGWLYFIFWILVVIISVRNLIISNDW